MKRIEATIHPQRLHDVMAALGDIGYGCSLITHVQSHGSGPRQVRQWRGELYFVDVQPRVRLEVLVHDALVRRALSVIRGQAGMLADEGDVIVVTSVESVIEVKTGVELCEDVGVRA